MITAISSIKQSGSLNNNVNIKRTNQVAFTGCPISLIKNEGKISRFADEASHSIGKMFKKALGKYELPFSKKPLTANADLTHFLPDGTPITISMPEVHTAVTKVLDGANILNPDAADLAANVADALSTKAALVDVLSGTSHAFDAVTSGLDAANSITTGIDATTAVVEHKTILADIAHGVLEILDKI